MGQFSNSSPKHFSYLCEYAIRFDLSCSFCEYLFIFHCLHCSPSCFDPDSPLLAHLWLGLSWIYCISATKTFSSPKRSSRKPYTSSKQQERHKHSVEITINLSERDATRNQSTQQGGEPRGQAGPRRRKREPCQADQRPRAPRAPGTRETREGKTTMGQKKRRKKKQNKKRRERETAGVVGGNRLPRPRAPMAGNNGKAETREVRRGDKNKRKNTRENKEEGNEIWGGGQNRAPRPKAPKVATQRNARRVQEGEQSRKKKEAGGETG